MSMTIQDDGIVDANEYFPAHGMTGTSEADIAPMYSGIISEDAIRHYQKQNNKEEVEADLSWSERLQAGATGAAHGIMSYGPERLYRSLWTIGEIFGSDDLQAFASEGVEREKRIREIDPFYQVPDNWMRDGWGRSLYEGTQGISSSLVTMLPGAAISLIPGGQGIGIATLAAGGGAVEGLASYNEFMEEAVEKFQGLNPSLTRKEIKDAAFWDAFYYGFSEGGISAATDAVGGRLLGLFGKAGVEPAKHILDRLMRNMTYTMITEAGGEVTTAMIQDYLREQAGLDYSGRVQAMKQALGPALVGGALFGIGGTALKVAQGKIQEATGYNPNPLNNHEGTAINNAGATDARGGAGVQGSNDAKAFLDSKAAQFRKEFREANYTPHAVDVFNKAMESGAGEMRAADLMEAVEGAAKSWAARTGNDAAAWTGDSGKLLDTLRRLEEHTARPDMTLAENLDSLRDVLLSELNPAQSQILIDAYPAKGIMNAEGIPGDNTTRPSVMDGEAFIKDFRALLDNPEYSAKLSPEVRPVMEQLRDGALDLYDIAGKRGLTGGFDPELSASIGRTIEHRKAHLPPPPPAFIVDPVGLENVRKRYGDFSKLSPQQQGDAIRDMAGSLQINFDKWDMPTDQKAMLGFIDTEMKPLLDSMLNRGKRSDARQEAMARSNVEAEGIDLNRFAAFTAELTGNGNLKQSAAVKARELQIAERLFLEKATSMGNIANDTMAPADIVKWRMAGALYEQVHSMLRSVRSEAGHLLRAFNYIKKDPFGSGKGASTGDTANPWARPYADPAAIRQRTQHVFENVLGGMDAAKVQLHAFTQATTPQERAGVIRDSLRAKTVDMFLEYRTLNLLSSIKTQIVNVAGNGLTLANETWNRFLAEKMGHGQGVAGGETWAFIGGLWDGLQKVKEKWSVHREQQGSTLKAARNISEMWGNDPASSLAGDAGINERKLTRENALDVITGAKEWAGLPREHGMISNGLSYMVEYMGRILGFSGDVLLTQDQFFKTIAAHAEVSALNYREAKRQSGGDKGRFDALLKQFQGQTPEAHKRAGIDFGKLVTFQSDLGKTAKAIDNLRHQVPLARALVPFFKTPANIIKYGAAHTPGVARLFDDIRADLKGPDLGKRHLAEARLMTGTMVWATAIGLATSGYLTGNGPVDKKEREKWLATGAQPNSIRIGDTYVALDRMDPAAFVLNTAASLVEIYDGMDDQDLSKAMWGGLGAAMRVVTERTYMRSLADAVSAVNDWTGPEGDRARRSFATSLIPASSLLRAVTQQIDPMHREIDGVFDAIRAGIPGASESLPTRRNFLGEEMKGDGYFGPDWFSPLRQSRDKHDPVYDEIYRLVQAGHKIPSMPDRIIRDRGQSVRMDGRQYAAFLELAGIGLKYGGMNAKERIASALKSQAYQGWDDEKKAKQIESIIESYRSEARKQMRRELFDKRGQERGWEFLLNGQ